MCVIHLAINVVLSIFDRSIEWHEVIKIHNKVESVKWTFLMLIFRHMRSFNIHLSDFRYDPASRDLFDFQVVCNYCLSFLINAFDLDTELTVDFYSSRLQTTIVNKTKTCHFHQTTRMWYSWSFSSENISVESFFYDSWLLYEIVRDLRLFWCKTLGHIDLVYHYHSSDIFLIITLFVIDKIIMVWIKLRYSTYSLSKIGNIDWLARIMWRYSTETRDRSNIMERQWFHHGSKGLKTIRYRSTEFKDIIKFTVALIRIRSNLYTSVRIWRIIASSLGLLEYVSYFIDCHI